jgi:hypothetical protein
VVQNRNQFKANVEVHDINTRQHFDFHQPLSSLAKYQKGVYYNGIKVFNSLPLYIKDKADDYRDFKLTLKHFLHKSSFYSLQEYFQYNKNSSLMVLFKKLVYILSVSLSLFHRSLVVE